MGTHPIFESDFDCLTGRRLSCSQKLKKMRYVAAYLLAQLGGNAAPDADALKAILSSVGVDADEEKLGKVLSELAGKNIDEVLAEGKEKLASVPSGGGAHPLPAVQQQPVEPPKKQRRRRKRSRPRAKTKIWDSASSIKPRSICRSYRLIPFCPFQTLTVKT